MKPPAVVLLSLLLLPLAGCLDGERDDLDAADVDAGPDALAPAPVADYLRDLSEHVAVPTVTLNLRTALDELVELDTWIVKPEGDGPFPVVLEVTPYYGGGEPESLGRLGAELVGRGYAVGVSSVRGTGNSGGCFTQGGPQEAKDTAAVVEHMAAESWSNGNVGLIGVSYPGTTPQDVWVEAPPALKTIVPISGISDLYKYNFVNGVPINVQGFGFNTYYWAMVGASPAGLSGGAQLLGDPAHVATAAAGEACTDQVDVQEGGVSSTADGNKDAYWQVRDFHAELRASWDRNPDRASVFYVHGLQDWNVKPHMMEDWLSAVQETGVPYKAWLGQWGHAWPAPTGASAECEYDEDADRGRSCRSDWWDTVLVAWFDQFLKGVDTGILDAPSVQVQDDDGVWRHEQAWPPTDVAWHRFALGDGALGQEATGTASYHDTHGGLTSALVTAQGLPDRVVWKSEPLESDWHVSGLPVFHANVTAEGQRASLVLSLGEELPDGTLRMVNFAAQSLNHVDSLASGDGDVSGKRQEVRVAFFPQDDVLHAGNRVVLVASGNTVGSPAPNLQPVSDGGLITIELEGAWLELPVDETIVVEAPQPYANVE